MPRSAGCRRSARIPLGARRPKGRGEASPGALASRGFGSRAVRRRRRRAPAQPRRGGRGWRRPPRSLRSALSRSGRAGSARSDLSSRAWNERRDPGWHVQDDGQGDRAHRRVGRKELDRPGSDLVIRQLGYAAPCARRLPHRRRETGGRAPSAALFPSSKSPRHMLPSSSLPMATHRSATSSSASRPSMRSKFEVASWTETASSPKVAMRYRPAPRSRSSNPSKERSRSVFAAASRGKPGGDPLADGGRDDGRRLDIDPHSGVDSPRSGVSSRRRHRTRVPFPRRANPDDPHPATRAGAFRRTRSAERIRSETSRGGVEIDLRFSESDRHAGRTRNACRRQRGGRRDLPESGTEIEARLHRKPRSFPILGSPSLRTPALSPKSRTWSGTSLRRSCGPSRAFTGSSSTARRSSEYRAHDRSPSAAVSPASISLRVEAAVRGAATSSLPPARWKTAIEFVLTVSRRAKERARNRSQRIVVGRGSTAFPSHSAIVAQVKTTSVRTSTVRRPTA